MTVALAALTDAPLDVLAHHTAVAGTADGAVASFVGLVRDHDPSVVGTVVALDYSAHPDAADVLSAIAARVADAHPGTTLAVTHRVGHLAVGEAAIVAAAASAHRAEAFEACRALVEAVKAELPIWKREILADGSHTWVGL